MAEDRGNSNAFMGRFFRRLSKHQDARYLVKLEEDSRRFLSYVDIPRITSIYCDYKENNGNGRQLNRNMKQRKDNFKNTMALSEKNGLLHKVGWGTEFGKEYLKYEIYDKGLWNSLQKNRQNYSSPRNSNLIHENFGANNGEASTDTTDSCPERKSIGFLGGFLKNCLLKHPNARQLVKLEERGCHFLYIYDVDRVIKINSEYIEKHEILNGDPISEVDNLKNTLAKHEEQGLLQKVHSGTKSDKQFLVYEIENDELWNLLNQNYSVPRNSHLIQESFGASPYGAASDMSDLSASMFQADDSSRIEEQQNNIDHPPWSCNLPTSHSSAGLTNLRTGSSAGHTHTVHSDFEEERTRLLSQCNHFVNVDVRECYIPQNVFQSELPCDLEHTSVYSETSHTSSYDGVQSPTASPTDSILVSGSKITAGLDELDDNNGVPADSGKKIIDEDTSTTEWFDPKKYSDMTPLYDDTFYEVNLKYHDHKNSQDTKPSSDTKGFKLTAVVPENVSTEEEFRCLKNPSETSLFTGANEIDGEKSVSLNCFNTKTQYLPGNTGETQQVFDECGENSPHQSKWDDNAIDTTDIVISGIPDAKKIKNNRKHKMPGSSSSCSSPKKKKTEVNENTVSTLPSNFYVKSPPMALTNDNYNAKTVCDNCESDETAESRCNDCKVFLCHFCTESHKRARSTKKHKLKSNPGPQKIAEKKRCPKRKYEIINRLKERKRRVLQKIEKLEGFEESLEAEWKSEIAEIIHHFDQLAKEMESRKMEMVEQATLVTNLKRKRIRAQLKVLERASASCDHNIVFTERVFTSGNDVQISTMEKYILQSLEELKDDQTKLCSTNNI